jgi:uncharacterized protein (TIGR02996 family)
MADHSGFLEAINAEPDDDVPRLIYADWLEDHGEPERAEFIRVQCRAATLPWDDERDALEDRAEELLRNHEDQWLGSLGHAACRCEYRRGFIERLHPRPAEYPQSFDDLFRLGPNCTVCLEPIHGNAPYAAFDWLDSTRLVGLDLAGFSAEIVVQCLARAGRLPRLRTLDLSLRAFPGILEETHDIWLDYVGLEQMPCLQSLAMRYWELDDGRLDALIGTGILTGLKRLDLLDNPLADEGIQRLAFMPELAGLESLGVSEISERGVQWLSESPDMGELSELELGFLHDAPTPAVRALMVSDLIARLRGLSVYRRGGSHWDLESLANVREPIQLRRLTLESSCITLSEIDILANSPLLTQLEVLAFNRTSNGPAALRRLLESSMLGSLRELRLTNNALSVEAMRALADWPGLTQLRVLDLTNCQVTDASLAELLRGLEGGRLRVLRLGKNRIQDVGRRLAEAPGLERLRELDLSGGTFLNDEIAPLLNSDALPVLTVLRLGGNRFDRDMVNLLVASPLVTRLRLLDLRPAHSMSSNSAARLRALLGAHVDVTGFDF